MAQLWDHLEDDSVDLIFTDPPYNAEGIPTYSELSRLAAAKLKPGALCLAYTGSYYLPEIMQRMGEHLDYHWLFCVKFAGRHCACHPKRIQIHWKAILGYGRDYQPRVWLPDFIQSQPDNKVKHDWQQPECDAEYFIRKLTKKSGLVVDPFVGSGTTLAAAKRLSRRWIGTEIDPQVARIARARLGVE
jgi:DNA modification methylase